jgi:hypothetical protein
MVQIQEQPGSFYLGQEHDLVEDETYDEPIYYDARDLTTHAVVLGMTGSGKTGLGAILLEEAALDGIPALVIDPKGDMTNLLLTFPELRAEDFAPWVDAGEARRKEMEVDDYAAAMAERWRAGLAATGQGPERIRRLRDAVEFAIYTPGSSAARGVSILQSLSAPRVPWDVDPEPIHERIGSTVSALLSLIGVDADPVRSREHILLSSILEDAWRQGEDLDLAGLIMRVQKPPLAQIGVFPLESFYPEDDRIELALLLNGLMASPTFADWLEGEPLEADHLLYTPEGKPRVSVLYIAHLSEAERQFFVTLLLEQVIAWMRAQTGTTSLRALLYMDELFGYLPPHPANPPTKQPFLTLLKTARAFGLGLVLTTQNPVDLDYKALTNAGTWFIGRMQAERDKERVLEGLEGVEVAEGGPSRAELDRMISALRSRVFLLHSVHRDGPEVFHTRWAMSYLRGPLTRAQLRQLAEEQAPAPRAAAVAVRDEAPEPVAAIEVELPYNPVPPQLPSSVKQVFLPVDITAAEALAAREAGARWPGAAKEAKLFYEPALLGLGVVRFPHNKSRQVHSEEVAYLVPLEGRGDVIAWAGHEVELSAEDVEAGPRPGALFAELPPALGESKHHTALKKGFDDYLYYNKRITLWHNPHVDLYSAPEETRNAFIRRVREAAREARDEEAAKLEARFDKDLERLEDKVRREERELEEDEIEYSARKKEELLSGAESVFDLFSGRSMRRSMSSASRKRRMTRQAKADVEESEEVIEELEADMEEMARERAEALEALTDEWAERIEDLEEIEVNPRRADVRVGLFALAWLPHWAVPIGDQLLTLRAYDLGE